MSERNAVDTESVPPRGSGSHRTLQRWIRCRPTRYRDCVKTRITASFLFVLLRVFSWIACCAPRKAIHEISRNHTNEVPRQIRVLAQSLPRGGTDSVTTAQRKPCNKNKILGTCYTEDTKTEQRNQHGSTFRAKSGAFLLVSSLMTSCSRAPSFDILGSYFPAWLICLTLGVVLTVVIRWLLLRLQIEVVFPIVVYPSLTALFGFGMWLVFYG